MADYLIKGETLTGIADAIRRKTGSTEDIKAKDMESSIDSISTGTDTSDATATADEIFAGEVAYGPDGKVTGTFTIENELTEQDNLISQITTLVNQKANPEGGTDTSDATATASDILGGKTAYVKGDKIIGTILTMSPQAPVIQVSSSGLITARTIIPEDGYYEVGTKSSTKQLTTKSATTYTPTTTDQTISSGTYLTGTQTIKGDANLKAENIVSGVSIFGVTGNATTGGGSGGGSVETVTGTIKANGPMIGDMIGGSVCYMDATGNIQTVTNAKTITVMKNSILIAVPGGDGQSVSGGITALHSGMSAAPKGYQVTGDFTLQI